MAMDKVMTSNSGRRRPAIPGGWVKPALALAVLLAASALAACTTAEGTNALVDPATFEREVMISTLQGVDLIPKDEKKPITTPRAPLVLPKQVAQLPPPSKPDTAAIPTDSDNPQINTAGLTDADLQRLRNARVVDLHSVAGRPLTDVERKQLTARMQAANMKVSENQDRPLILPPESYFAGYDGGNTVCRANDGTLVALNDKRCPAKIRDAMRKKMDTPVSVSTSIQQQITNMQEGKDANGN
jgi:hypothetical protein